MNPTQIKQNVLVLTSDSEQQAKLRRKLEEYAGRYRFTSPEVDPGGTYRHRLLDELLEKQVVDLDAFEKECAEKFGWHFEQDFQEAVAIITAYNSGDLQGIRPGSGTGLR
jgi:hypothetical protein